MNDHDLKWSAGSLLPQQIIEEKTANEIEVYRSGRGKSSIHQSARNLSQNVSDDYGNRFLFELIQNAHDAHPSGTLDGQIAVVFEPDEGDFGCLYVANRGNGFSEKNFRALTNIALSSKPVNESIGNKGLGFRSVLQICQWPEIYSVGEQGARGNFDGYCFRFANRSDLTKFIAGPEADVLAEELLETMPCWYLPVYVADRPGIVGRFAEEKFASVVRLPLDSDKARELVLEQFDALLEREHPLHLFLDRVACIRLEREPGQAQLLQRKITARWVLSPSLKVERVAIGENDYLVGLYDLDQEKFRKTLDLSIARKEVPESWRNWQGTAQVSIAVRLGASVDSGQMYCFLPLGNEGKAPFAGYINANFHTKMDRRAVIDGVGLNRYFINTAAELSCVLIEFLIRESLPEAPGAVVDLLCWNHPYSAVVKAMLGKRSGGLLEQRILPTQQQSGGVRWSSPKEALIWDAQDSSCFSSDTVSRLADAPILVDSLSDAHLAALLKFFSTEGVSFKPNSGMLASWTELVAADLLERDVPMTKWADFYDEIALHFKPNASPLFGKRFLLSVNRELIASEPVEASGRRGRRRRAADVYFPPVRQVGSDSQDGAEGAQLPLEELPAELQKGFALLHRAIPWINDRGGFRPGRSFLLAEKLVREYDTSDVIRTLAVDTQSDAPSTTKEQALCWAFRFWSSGRELGEKDTRAAGLFVPTRGGWRSAESSMFGSGWSSCPHGKRLESFVKSAASMSPQLATQYDCFLLPFSDWISERGEEEDWVRFLSAAGVREHLQPVASERTVRDGRAGSLAHELAQVVPGLSDESRQLWSAALGRATKEQFSTVTYRAELTPWQLPGLNESNTLSSDLRREYGAQVIRAVTGLRDNHLGFRVYRPGNPASGPATVTWPTPLATLLREGCWMPVMRGNSGLRFVRPKEAWYFSEEDETRPRFMELLAPTVAKLVDESTNERLRKLADLKTLNDLRDSLSALGAYVEVARSGISDSRDVRRFRELFDQVWSQVAPLDEGVDIDALPVLVGTRIETFELNSENGSSVTRLGYFLDAPDTAKEQLVTELQLPAFVFGRSVSEDTWGWLEALAPDRFLRLSSEQLDVVVDGVSFESSVRPPLLSQIFGSWISDFIVCAAEHKGGAFFKATQSVLGKLRHAAMNLRVHMAERIQISMSGAVRELPGGVYSAFVHWLSEGPVLIIQNASMGLDLKTLSAYAEQLALALGYPVLASALEAALLRLSDQAPDCIDNPPGDEDIAFALGVPVDSVTQTLLYVRAELSHQLPLAALLSAVVGEAQAFEQLFAFLEEDLPPEDAIQASLRPVAQRLGLDVPTLSNRLSMASSPKDLTEEFALPLADVNRVIRECFSQFEPLNNEDSHRRQMKAYLTLNSVKYINLLRGAFLSKFEAGVSLSEYVQLRDQYLNLEPSPDWFESYGDLPEDVLHARVKTWLECAYLTSEAPVSELPALSDCRLANAKQLRDFWNRFGPVLSAWVRLADMTVTPQLRSVWVDPSVSVTEYLALAHKDGWMDFRLLDDSAIQQRLVTYGIWPKEKPLSTRYDDWGISEESVCESAAQMDNERESARLKRLKLNVNGAEILATEDNYSNLVSAVTENFGTASGLADLSLANQKLADAEAPPSGGTGGGSVTGKRGGGEPRSPDAGLSDAQKQAVGLIGELYAKEWIRRFYREKHGMELDDSCWVSGYSGAVLGAKSGDDRLGYDMIVRLKTVTHYYEVKASVGDSRVFEMGPTEIAAAHRHRGDKEHRYRVLYVSHATDHKRTKITLLPNPFSKEGARALRPVGRGSVTFEFKLKD